MEHLCSLTVRGYELDSFGHVNNSVYFSYCEWARWQMFADRGWQTFMDNHDLYPIVIEQKMKYIKELKNYDVIDIRSNYRIKGIRLICEHRLFKNEVLHAKCLVNMAILDIDRQIHAIPEFIQQVMHDE